jgi:hypothetical protein
VICISQPNLFGAQAPALKPVEAPKHDREREKKKFEFFGRLHTKIHRKPTLFRKVSYKKPKNGTLVTTEFGGGRYQSSVGICRGPLDGPSSVIQARDRMGTDLKMPSSQNRHDLLRALGRTSG